MAPYTPTSHIHMQASLWLTGTSTHAWHLHVPLIHAHAHPHPHTRPLYIHTKDNLCPVHAPQFTHTALFMCTLPVNTHRCGCIGMDPCTHQSSVQVHVYVDRYASFIPHDRHRCRVEAGMGTTACTSVASGIHAHCGLAFTV